MVLGTREGLAQVKLAFQKQTSLVGHLHQLPTPTSEIVEVLIRVAVLFLWLSGWLRHQLFGLQKLWRAGILRTLKVMAEWADTMPELVATQSEAFERRCMLEMLQEQMRDPNQVRERAFAIAPIAESPCGQAPSLNTYASFHRPTAKTPRETGS